MAMLALPAWPAGQKKNCFKIQLALPGRDRADRTEPDWTFRTQAQTNRDGTVVLGHESYKKCPDTEFIHQAAFPLNNTMNTNGGDSLTGRLRLYVTS